MFFRAHTDTDLPGPGEALPGRPEPAFPLARRHRVSGRPLLPPFPEHCRRAIFAMGCFWGAERLFWKEPGVWVTAVGYTGGITPNPLYAEVCSGRTGHAEAVLVVFEPAVVSYARLLTLFFTHHDPTQGMRQGNDIGTQYRSAIFTFDAGQQRLAEAAAALYGRALRDHGRRRPITTEIRPAGEFYYAEPEHQQYLAANPQGYCGLAGTGVPFPAAELAALAAREPEEAAPGQSPG